MMTFNSKSFLLVIALLLFSALAQARDPLSFTTTDRHGDCVHSGISTKKSLLEAHIDKQYCADGNIGNPDAIAQCIANKSQSEAEPFYHDCGDNQNYIGLNNKTYPLKRIGKEPTHQPFLIGNYKGDDIKVEVKKIRLLERAPDIEDAEYYEVLKYEVWLIVTQGKSTTKIKGILDEGI